MCIKSVALSYTPAITGGFMALLLFLQQTGAGQLPENSPKTVNQRCVHSVIEEGLTLSTLVLEPNLRGIFNSLVRKRGASFIKLYYV